MKKLIKKVKHISTRLYTNGQLLRMRCAQTLANEAGLSELVMTIILILASIVVVTVVFFPDFFDTVKGTLDNADSKIDALWDYKG